MKRVRGEPFKKGNIPWNKGTKGKMVAWNKGIKTGLVPKSAFKHGHEKGMTGKHHSDETKMKISEANKGSLGYWLDKKHPLPKRVRQNICIDCGKPLSTIYAKRCKTCWGNFNSGKNHPNWKNGISKDVHSPSEPKYKKWRNKVFERDNWTCRECGAEKIYIEAHHIKSWSEYPKLRYDLENGLTLCKQCHVLTDNYKGKTRKVA